MNKKALFIIPPEGFNDDEFNEPNNILTSAGIDVTVSSTITGEINGDYGSKAISTAVFSSVDATTYDVIAVIGGSGTRRYLWNDTTLIDYLKATHKKNIIIAGICAGSVVIAKTGLLSGRSGTCYPVDFMINQLIENNVTYLAQSVVEHKDIITSNGPMGAADFGNALLKLF